MEVRTVSAANGFLWYQEGWRCLKKDIGLWLVLTLAFFGFHIVINAIPVVGSLVTSLLTPAIMGALFFVADERTREKEAGLRTLLVPFKDISKRNALLTLGLVNIAYIFLTILTLAVSMVGAGGISVVTDGSTEAVVRTVMGAGVFAIFIILAMSVLLTMAMIYAIPIIMFNDIGPIDAMQLSIQACLRNFFPLFVFALVYLGLIVFCMITLGLGFLLLFPLTVCTLYSSYKDIFV